MQARIQFDGPDGQRHLESLAEWLGREPKLRGCVAPERKPPGPGNLGSLPEALIAVLGNAEAVTALAASLTTWLLTRRSQVTVKVTGRGGRSVRLDIRSTDAEGLLRAVLEERGEDRPGFAEDRDR